jgi:hypothetical protein
MVRRVLVPLVCSIALILSTRPAAAQQPLVRVTDIDVQSVVAEGNQLIANAVVTLDVVGRTITQNVQIPLALGGTPGAPSECDILNLAVGPLNLDLLGLVVNLDDCDGGPVTVDIVAIAGDGLLGDLLCSVAGLLSDGINLGDILGELPADDLTSLTGAIQDILNEVFGQLLTTGTPATTAQQANQGNNHQCNVLLLELPDGLTLELLGLLVDTSPICLDIHAEEGSGNLLGNLLCQVSHLLDRPANGNAVQAQIRKISRLLDSLEL